MSQQTFSIEKVLATCKNTNPFQIDFDQPRKDYKNTRYYPIYYYDSYGVKSNLAVKLGCETHCGQNSLLLEKDVIAYNKHARYLVLQRKKR